MNNSIELCYQFGVCVHAGYMTMATVVAVAATALRTIQFNSFSDYGYSKQFVNIEWIFH